MRQTAAKLTLLHAVLLLMTLTPMASARDAGLIDDFSSEDGLSRLGTSWRLVTDRVMGGVSNARAERINSDGRPSLCMRGDVSLENNGGFAQINLDLAPSGLMDASTYDGVRLIVRGNGERYNLHLKTASTVMPWQSYRAEFGTDDQWREVYLPFTRFEPHRLVPTLDLARLKRIGIVAIGRAMQADICVAEIGFYRD
jgi:hypothetical protein